MIIHVLTIQMSARHYPTESGDGAKESDIWHISLYIYLGFITNYVV